jgi:hypothetical protein
MSSVSTRFDLGYKVESVQWVLCRHVLTWVIRSIFIIASGVDTFWQRHLCRHGKFWELSKVKFLFWELKFPKIRNQPTLWQFDSRTFFLRLDHRQNTLRSTLLSYIFKVDIVVPGFAHSLLPSILKSTVFNAIIKVDIPEKWFVVVKCTCISKILSDAVAVEITGYSNEIAFEIKVYSNEIAFEITRYSN